MKRNLKHLESTSFDLLVIGGGIYGLACAYDAAQRGFNVALIDRADFGGSTSTNHLKTGHGGLRSLQTGNFWRAREAITERYALARIAPLFLRPLPFLVQTTHKFSRSQSAFRAAFIVDSLLGYDRNLNLLPELHLPAGRIISSAECKQHFGDLIAESQFTGGALWYDYQIHQAERLNISFALGATKEGACLTNYVEATEPIFSGKKIEGIHARDVLTGRSLEIRAALTIDTTGPNAGKIASTLGTQHRPVLQKAINVVTTRPMRDPSLGVPGPDGGFFLLISWLERAMLGTWHLPEPADPSDTSVSEEELSRFLSHANKSFPGLHLCLNEISLVHHGLVPAQEHQDGHVTQASSPRILDHASEGITGAISVFGVKYTTARGVAEQVINLASRKLKCPIQSSQTGTTILPGASPLADRTLFESARQAGLTVSSEQHLIATYGDRSHLVLECAAGRQDLLTTIVPASPTIGAEIIYATRHEMACTLLDVTARRTSLGIAGHPGTQAASTCSELLKKELNWTSSRTHQELEALDAHYAPVKSQNL